MYVRARAMAFRKLLSCAKNRRALALDRLSRRANALTENTARRPPNRHRHCRKIRFPELLRHRNSCGTVRRKGRHALSLALRLERRMIFDMAQWRPDYMSATRIGH